MPGGRTLGQRHALAVVVDRNRRLVPVLHGPDDVRRAERRVTAEKHARTRRHERRLVDHRHVPLAELQPDLALDEGERVVLADRQHDRVARKNLAPDDLLLQPLGRFDRPELVELHPGQHAVLDDEAHRLQVLDDLDAFFLGVLELPRRGLEVLPRLAGDDLDVGRAEPLRRPAAVHRRVADADDEHALADRLHVAEMNRLQPLDADEDLIGVVPSRNVELLALRRAAPDKHRIELAAVEQRLEAVHRRVVADLDAHVDDVADFFVEDLLGEPERGDVDAHQAAGPRQLLENRHLVAERREVVGHRQRRRTGADEPDLLAVRDRRRRRQEMLDLVAIVRRDALQAADGDRLAVDPRAPAGRLARPVAGSPEDARKHVGLAIEEVGLGEPSLRDEADVFRARSCARDTPTGSPPRGGSSSGRRRWWASSGRNYRAICETP